MTLAQLVVLLQSALAQGVPPETWVVAYHPVVKGRVPVTHLRYQVPGLVHRSTGEVELCATVANDLYDPLA